MLGHHYELSKVFFKYFYVKEPLSVLWFLEHSVEIVEIDIFNGTNRYK